MTVNLSPTAAPLEIDCRTVKAKLDAGEDFLLLDCREADEHRYVRIPQARLLPMSEIQERLGEIEDDRGREIVVHCHHGVRSLQVAVWLRQQGFAEAKSMSGGIDRWAAEIDPELPRY